jgi:hypothetical protein
MKTAISVNVQVAIPRVLLNAFIVRRIREYKEPRRKGTPKGQPVGLSRVKYAATLLTLGDEGIKETANRLKVSYALLRKWRSEKGFKQQVQRNRRGLDAFCAQYIPEIQVNLERRYV